MSAPSTTGSILPPVPFFYHCEHSTNVEDLAFGYMAFAEGDMVYILLNKSADTVTAQAYIIGHVDIRSTRKCLDPEYLVVTLALTYKGTYHSYITIFDASTGAKINLTNLRTLSEVRPSRPASRLLPLVLSLLALPMNLRHRHRFMLCPALSLYPTGRTGMTGGAALLLTSMMMGIQGALTLHSILAAGLIFTTLPIPIQGITLTDSRSIIRLYIKTGGRRY